MPGVSNPLGGVGQPQQLELFINQRQALLQQLIRECSDPAVQARLQRLGRAIDAMNARRAVRERAKARRQSVKPAVSASAVHAARQQWHRRSV